MRKIALFLTLVSTLMVLLPTITSAQQYGVPFQKLQEQVDGLKTQANDLQTQIDAEEAARMAADDDLQMQIDDLGTKIEALGGDTFVVTSDEIRVAPGQFQVFGNADCPDGSVVTGGGYSFAMFIDTPYDPSKIWVKQSRPAGSSGWQVEVWNIDDVNPQPPFTVYAICLPR